MSHLVIAAEIRMGGTGVVLLRAARMSATDTLGPFEATKPGVAALKASVPHQVSSRVQVVDVSLTADLQFER